MVGPRVNRSKSRSLILFTLKTIVIAVFPAGDRSRSTEVTAAQ